MSDGLDWEAPGGGGAAPAESTLVRRTANQIIANGTDTTPAWDTETYDEIGVWDPATPGRFTIIEASLYVVTCNVKWEAAAAGSRGVYLRKNAAEIIANQTGAPAPTAGYTTSQQVFIYDKFVAGDFIEARVIQSSGGPLELRGGDAGAVRFSITKLG